MGVSLKIMSITITENAAKHVNNHLANRGKGIGLRLGVKTTGCSGLAYVIEFADKVENDDKVFEDNGIKLIVNPKSYVYLKGTQLDLGKDKCGCGESFNV